MAVSKNLWLTMGTSSIVLDDGSIYVDLNANYEASKAPGFLMCRCDFGPTRPEGVECIGSFGKSTDGTWNARINALYDPLLDSDCRVVASGASRMDAIAALWTARHDAHRQLV